MGAKNIHPTRKIIRSWRKRGASRTARLIAFNILRPINRDWAFWLKDGEFDRRFGTDTTGAIDADKLDDQGVLSEQSTGYEGTEIEAFHDIIRSLDIQRYEDFVFIDIGSGKGRTLMMASDYPFRQVLGVEYSRDLHDAAEKNLKIYRNPKQKCFDLRSICQDATTYEFPDRPLVLYVANPFGPELMKAFLQNLRGSLLKNPREMHFFYYVPEHDQLLRQADFLEPVASPPELVELLDHTRYRFSEANIQRENTAQPRTSSVP